MTATLHPTGYGTQYLTLPELIMRHCTQCEPEMVLRLINYLEEHPQIGIGGAIRPCPSNTSEASRQCKSFHQLQTFGDGTIYFCAFDLVRANPLGPTHAHVSLRTGDLPVQGSVRAALPPLGYGIHANVSAPGKPGWEPWHGQPSEIDGFDSWAAAGRPRPVPVLTNTPPPPPDPQPPVYDLTLGDHMLSTYHPLANPQRFYDTRGFGTPSMPAGEYTITPPYPPYTSTPVLDDGQLIVGVKVGVKIITPTFTGFACAYTFTGQTPGTSILDFPGPSTPGDPPAYNCLIDIPVTEDGHFQIYQSVPAHIAVDLYGYWT